MSDDETTLQQALFTTGHEESGSSDFDEYIQDEGAETASSGSSFDELDDSEFPRYFSERRGRLYHSSTTAPYPLPVDTPEQQRHTVSHNILKRLMGGNYLGPVPAALAAGQDRKVLDLCTGNGKWVTEMAEEFPHVSFTGIDIVPIATRYPPDNVRFILADANQTLDWPGGTYDFVHARDTLLAIVNYDCFVAEVARVLKPGGLFLSVEWDRSPHFHPSFDLDPKESAPASMRFSQLVCDALLHSRGMQHTSFTCSSSLAASPHFTNHETYKLYVPIGGWHLNPMLRRVGLASKVAQTRLARACRELLVDNTPLTPDEVENAIQDYVDELRSTDGLMATVHVACATRV